MAAAHFTSKADPSDVRAANRRLMFDLLFPENHMSRAELGRSTGLSRVAASEAVGDMLDKHILRETGTDAQQDAANAASCWASTRTCGAW